MNCSTSFSALCIAVFLALISEIVSSQGLAAEESKQNLEKTRAELFGQVLALIPEEKVPAQFLTMRRSFEGRRCGTMILAQAELNFDIFTREQQDFLRKALARPVLPFEYESPSREFLLHYATTGRDAVATEDNNGNSVPDYVEAVAVMFDSSFDIQVNDLGYRKPPSDDNMDGPEYDVYISSLPSGFYGLTTPENSVASTPNLFNDRTSYIEVDNDFMSGQFTEGLDGARVTAAHEFFHAIQFGYRTGLANNDFWYYELCSTWMEEVIYDDVDDYYSTVPHFFSRAGEPFNVFDSFSLKNYGSSVWNLFLDQKYNDPAMVRRTWEIMQDQRNLSQGGIMDAIKQMLLEKGTRFETEFAEFALWNYFTSSRVDSDDRYEYEEADAYPLIRLHGNFSLNGDTTIVDSSFSSSHRYYRFETLVTDAFALTASVVNPDEWRFVAIVTPPSGPGTVQIFKPPTSINLGDGLPGNLVPQFSEVTVVPVNALTLEADDLAKLRSERSRFTFNLLQVPLSGGDSSGITNAYPNPFRFGLHDQIKFEFGSTATLDLQVRILSSTGRVVRTVRFGDGDVSLLPGEFSWDGTNDQQEVVASGIYVFQLQQNDFVAMRKFAVIRE